NLSTCSLRHLTPPISIPIGPFSSLNRGCDWLSAASTSRCIDSHKQPREAEPVHTRVSLPPKTSSPTRNMARPRVFFDITINGATTGRIVMELRADVVPKTAGTFLKAF
ncbi:hypothetical protein FQN60_009245, partial [Etheostoma spectabile]